MSSIAQSFSTSSCLTSWDNHFEAFGAQDVEKILLDYTDSSQIVVYDVATGRETIYRGLSGVKECFVELFGQLTDLSSLDAPIIINEENPQGMTFLVWECPSSGIACATDTFIYDEKGKISKQNVVVWPASAAGAGACESTDPTGGPCQASWDNHFAAFGAQDVPRILDDYTEASVVRVYNRTTKKLDTFRGLQEVEQCFTGLFGALSDLSALAASLIKVEENPEGMVLLAWECPSSGFVKATDTFIFDSAGKIVKQNVVVETA